MKYSNTNKELLTAQKLPIIESIEDLSKLTHLSSGLIFNLSKYNKRYYKVYKIKGKNRKERTICAPKYSMKVLQLWILRNILENIEVHPKAMAYRKGSLFGIKGAAEIHTGYDYLLKTDVSNFFDSIKRKEVYHLFNNLGYSISVSNILSDLCTLNNSIPQGAITSPYLTNLIMKNFDCIISEYSDNNEINYTRYADDMVFSAHYKQKLAPLLKLVETNLNIMSLEINREKTKIYDFNNRQAVTGIIVNNEGVLHIKREIKYKLRSRIYQELKSDKTLSNQTKGYLSYVKSVDSERYNYFLGYIKKLENSIDKQS